QAELLEHDPGAPGDGGGACLHGGIGFGIEGNRFDQGHRQAGIGHGTGERSAGEAAADHGKVEVGLLAGQARPSRIKASIAPGSFGTAAVSTSGAPSVMQTSSSTRMPMPRYWAGAALSRAMYRPGSMVSVMPGSSGRHSPSIM